MIEECHGTRVERIGGLKLSDRVACEAYRTEDPKFRRYVPSGVC